MNFFHDGGVRVSLECTSTIPWGLLPPHQHRYQATLFIKLRHTRKNHLTEKGIMKFLPDDGVQAKLETHLHFPKGLLLPHQHIYQRIQFTKAYAHDKKSSN